MIVIKRINQYNKDIIETGKFLLYTSAIKYLKQFGNTNNILIEIKIFDGNKSDNNKQSFYNYQKAIEFLKQKNGEN